jgi:hypothetical protein
MGERKEMAFYDRQDLVFGEKRVTLRLAREGEDKYNEFKTGNTFLLNCEDSIQEGSILADWVVPFKDVPTEYLLAEGYKIEMDPFQDSPAMIDYLFKLIAKKDLERYYEIDENTLLHVIVYTPLVNDNPDLFKLPNETPFEWARRCGDAAFGHLETYRNRGDRT